MTLILQGRAYDVGRDGRFLMLKGQHQDLALVVNWPTRVKEALPVP